MAKTLINCSSPLWGEAVPSRSDGTGEGGRSKMERQHSPHLAPAAPILPPQGGGTKRFPPVPLFGAAIVVVATIAIVSAVRLGGIAVAPTFPDAEPTQSRTLIFADAPDGGILVTDAKTGEQVTRAAPGSNGFLRGSLRGLMRVRKVDEAKLTAPFILARWPSGQLTLEDTATQVKLDLRAYGPDNLKVFEAFLPKTEGVKP